MKKKIIVNDETGRIDKFLAEYLDESRSTIVKIIEAENVLVNGKVAKASYEIKQNDEIEVGELEVVSEDVLPVKMDLDIIYEDNDLMIINKPSGLVVHPGSGNFDNTLVNGLMYYTNNLSDINGEVRPGIVHRIDKDTSGLMVVAKNNKAHNILAEGFKNKTIKREYTALLDGILPHNSATIDAPIGRDKIDRKKMTVTSDNSKDAVTQLKVIKRFKEHTLVKLVLETGRTHQIRVHMKYIGFPVYNDPVYNTKKSNEFGQYLHSSKIKLNHPITNKLLEFEIELPKEMLETLNTLENIV